MNFMVFFSLKNSLWLATRNLIHQLPLNLFRPSLFKLCHRYFPHQLNLKLMQLSSNFYNILFVTTLIVARLTIASTIIGKITISAAIIVAITLIFVEVIKVLNHKETLDLKFLVKHVVLLAMKPLIVLIE